MTKKKEKESAVTTAPNAPAAQMRVEMMSLDELLAMRHKRNPKEHDVPGLMASFRRFGFTAPPMIDESTSVLVAGHGRCKALLQMRIDGEPAPKKIVVEGGVWFVPVYRGVSFENEKERDAYVIADNQHTIHGGWDMDALTSVLEDLRDVGFEGMGFEAPDIEAMLGGGGAFEDDKPNVRPLPDPPPRKELDQDEIPDAPAEPVTKRGDIWKLGDSILICNDCTSIEPKVLRIGKLGFALTSPPYNAGKNVERAVHGKAGGDSRYQESDDSMDADEYAELLRASTTLCIESCAVAAVNLQSLAQNKRVIARWAARFADHLVDRAVWVKTTTQPAINKNVLNSQFEDVYIFANAKRPKRTIETARFHGTISNVHEGASAARDNEYADIHGATMPVHLAQWAIENLGARADFIVDPFGGTGTTLIVATQLERRAALIELDPRYCDVIIERWKKLTGGEPKRVGHVLDPIA